MRARLRRMRRLVERYRIDRRLPPEVLTIYTDVARLRLRHAVGVGLARMRPLAGGRGRTRPESGRLGHRRYAVAGRLDAPLAEIGHQHAQDVVEAMTAAGVRPFVVDREAASILLGVLLEERAAALAGLTDLAGDSGAWYVEWHDRRGSGIVDLRRARRRRRVRLARQWNLFQLRSEGDRAVGHDEAVEITFWTPGTSGELELVGTRGHYRFDDRSPETVETIAGRDYPGRTAFPVGSNLERLGEPVDIVYTWVDGADPEWFESMATWARQCGRAADDSALDPARFRSRDELRYSLRSIWRNCGWARHVYIVTAGQRPDWLGDHEWVSMIDHSEILPADALPTFNSHAIESALHHIDGLAEHFVYANDDMCAGRALQPECFFAPNGLSKVFQSRARVPGVEDAETQHYDTAARRGRELLHQRFGRVVSYKPLHTFYPLRKSVLYEIEAQFTTDIERTAHSRFRSSEDLSIAASFAQHYGLATGRSVLGAIHTDYVHVESGRLTTQLERLQLARDSDTFCINETADPGPDADTVDTVLRDFYEDYFPVPAPWELDHPAHP